MSVVIDDLENSRASARAARRALQNYGRYLVDFLNVPYTTPEEVMRTTTLDGWEYLDDCAKSGDGVIVATGHVGRWDYSPLLLSQRYPGRICAVAENFKSAAMDRIIEKMRANSGLEVISMSNVRGMVKAMKDGKIMGVLVDRPVNHDGVSVTFFGQQTSVPGGAATLSSMTGATIIPGVLTRQHGGGFHGTVLPPLPKRTGSSRSEFISQTTQDIFTALEHLIRLYPDQWFMFRNMWPRLDSARVTQE